MKLVNDSGKMKVEFNTMFHVATLGPGKSFGELALINNVRRSATVVAVEDSTFAVIKKKDFDEAGIAQGLIDVASKKMKETREQMEKRRKSKEDLATKQKRLLEDMSKRISAPAKSDKKK